MSNKTNNSSTNNAAATTEAPAAAEEPTAEPQQQQQQPAVEAAATTEKMAPEAGDVYVVSPLSLAPSLLDETKFNVDADVLARSPTGSVVYLTAIQGQAPTQPEEGEKGQGEGQTQEDVAITVTSPQGTEREVNPTPLKAGEEEDQQPKSLGSNASAARQTVPFPFDPAT